MISEILFFNKQKVKQIEDMYLTSDQSDKKLFHLIIWALRNSECRYIVIEAEYIDRDFSEDYSSYYSTLFYDLGKKCCRIHFFSRSSGQDISSLFGEKRTQRNSKGQKFKINVHSLRKAYLGFIVILPTTNRVIGRTAIRSDVFCKNERYCTSKCLVQVNIEGIPLTIEVMPFIQQDEQIGVCSSTAVWMATCYMSIQYKFQRASLSKITEAANRYHKINRVFPALRGLMPEQIIESFASLGYDAIHYQKRTFPQNTWYPKELIYKYIESELPVIVVFGGQHACVVFGHNIDLSKNISDEKNRKTKIISNSAFITYFIAHDDLRGPYQLLPTDMAQPLSQIEYEDDFDPFLEEPSIYTNYTILDVTNIIIPIFKKVYLEGQVVENLISRIFSSKASIFLFYTLLIDKYQEIISKETVTLGESFLKLIENKEIFYRTRFILSNHFKEDYLLGKSSVSFYLSNHYSQLDLPRYIWLVELFIEKELKESIPKNGKNAKVTIGEILINATGNDDTSSIISVHFPGILFISNIYESKTNHDEDEDFLAYEILKDTSYELYDRR